MGKFGVGIGDEFPIEDQKPSENAGGPSGPGDPDYERRREEWRKAREAWRDQRRQWREEWRARWREHKRAIREEMRARYGDDAYAFYGHDRWHSHGGWHGSYGGHRFLLHALMIAGLVALAIAIFSHLYIVFGLAVLGALYYAYRRDADYFDFMPPVPRPRQEQAPTPHSTGTPPSSPPAATPQA